MRWKTIYIFILACFLCCACAAYADPITTIQTWSQLNDALKVNNNVIQLHYNITATSEDTELFIPSGVSIELDLNGKTIDRHLSEPIEHGHVLHVEGSLVLKDSGTNGTITGGNTTGAGNGVTNNHPSYGGGILVRNGGLLTMYGGTISENKAWCGGGIATNPNDKSKIVIRGGKIIDNIAESGGGIYASSKSSIAIYDCLISNNSAINNYYHGIGGGGIFAVWCELFEINGGIIENNHAANGAGIYLQGVKLTMNNGVIRNNVAESSNSSVTYKGYGGGIYLYEGSSLIQNGGKISNNTAKFGGGIYNYNSSVTLVDGEICDNTSFTGGGVYNAGSFTMKGGSIRKNVASYNGGGVSGGFSMYGGVIEENESSYGGGIISGHLVLYKGIIRNNISQIGGGVCSLGKLYINNKEIQIYGNTLDDLSTPSNLMVRVPYGVDQEGHIVLDNNTPPIIINNETTIGNPIGVTLINLLNKDDVHIYGNPTNGLLAGSEDGTKLSESMFVSENENYEVILKQDGRLYLDAPLYITFKPNGGEGTMERQKSNKGTDKIIKCLFTKEGYVFNGWNTKEDGTGNSFVDQDNIDIDFDITLYAQWIKTEETEQKVDMQPLDQVPPELRSMFESIDQIKAHLTNKLIHKLSRFNNKQIVYMNIKLMVSTNGGRTWVEATKENFPAGGIRARLPFPAGTNGKQYRFVVSHMYTCSWPERGWHLGQIDLPTVTWDNDGLWVTFRSLSPVAIAWEKIDDITDDLPQTGDDSHFLLWSALAVVCIAAVTIVMKKRVL